MSIGDISRMCEIPVHTIRFWEQEFGAWLCPGRTAGGQRRYTDEDIACLLRIKDLLWGHRFSIRAARRMLRDNPAPGAREACYAVGTVIDAVNRRTLRENAA